MINITSNHISHSNLKILPKEQELKREKVKHKTTPHCLSVSLNTDLQMVCLFHWTLTSEDKLPPHAAQRDQDCHPLYSLTGVHPSVLTGPRGVSCQRGRQTVSDQVLTAWRALSGDNTVLAVRGFTAKKLLWKYIIREKRLPFSKYPFWSPTLRRIFISGWNTPSGEKYW